MSISTILTYYVIQNHMKIRFVNGAVLLSDAV